MRVNLLDLPTATGSKWFLLQAEVFELDEICFEIMAERPWQNDRFPTITAFMRAHVISLVKMFAIAMITRRYVRTTGVTVIIVDNVFEGSVAI